jgi:hypothetical protein
MGFGSKEENGNMFLKSFYIGNTYAQSLSIGIKGKFTSRHFINFIDHNKLKKMNLSRCGLKDEGFVIIMQNAPYNLQELDISENNTLGIKCYEVLSNYLDNRDQR